MKKGSGDEFRAEEDFFANPYAKIDEVIEKKRRNLEKRKIRLLQYEEDERNGRKLTEEQVQALSRIGEVETQIEFVKEILKILTSLHKDFNRAKKQREEALKREQAQRERKSMADFIRHQNLLRTLGNQQVRKAFADGSNGAVKLEENEFSVIDFLNGCFNPSAEDSTTNGDWESKCEKSASQIHAILNGTKEKVLEKRTGFNMKEFLEKIASCQYIKDFIANQLTTEEENVENEKPVDKDGVVTKEDPKVVFVQGEGEVSKESSETDGAEATTTEFGYEGYATQVDPNANETPPVDSVSKNDENSLATADHAEFGINGVQNETPVPWAPASNSEVKSEKTIEVNENAFVEGVFPNRAEKRLRGGVRGGSRYRENLPRDGNERRRVPKDGRQLRNFENAYGQRGSGRSGRGPARGGFSRGGNRSQNSHMIDLTNGYGNGVHYNNRYSYTGANPPRRIGLNFASDVGDDNRK